LKRNNVRDLLLVIAAILAGYFTGKYIHRGSDPEDIKILEVLVDENASLKEQVELQKKLIEAYEAERQEISNKTNPA
jgi:hypothetical protein